MLTTLWREIATREKNIWAELLVTLLAAAYYVELLAAAPVSGPEDLATYIRGLIGLVVMIVIVASVLATVIALTSEAELRDERDYRIDAIANRVAYYLLIACIIGVCVLLFSNATPVAALLGKADGMVAGTTVANVLILALLIASVARALVQLYLYRRGIGAW
ncbi:hypothetical protein [Biformimicrobium ophioploci]|uniref:Uncharacterized protein n=1 Tax=Biformimicrobium ophioploci TaxID=3036711 RepID=A0ABQ6LWW4_9GAMM|nr:hypothetical protein [Microbulbifer sp. NKW57]GMG86558.1 hypothetical protein MNKW57_08790 [Microbulbifer sp. NKW57]